MVVSWKDVNGKKITALYWYDGLNLQDIKKYSNESDYIQVWYPRNLSDDIYEEYKELLTFIEIEASWKGESTSSHIDLSLNDEEILQQFSKTRRYEVRRAKERDNLEVEFHTNLDEIELKEFETFYNSFAKQTGELGKLDIEKVRALNATGQFVLAKVKDNNHEVLTIHGYVIDKEKRIAALFSSSSFFRENQEKKALIARANALLHYQSMIYFKNNGYEIYDFGGVYLGDKNKHYMTVAAFKRSFGGNIARYQNGFMIPIHEAEEIDKNLTLYKHELEENDIVIWGYASFGKYVEKQLKLRFSKISKYIIDNKLCNQGTNCVSEQILNELDENRTFVVVTTSAENYYKIISQNNCMRFAKNEKIVCLRKE